MAPVTQIIRSHHRLALKVGLCALALTFNATRVYAQWNEQVLYSFQGGTDGARPIGAMVFDRVGNVYGATNQGGSTSCASPSQCGTLFELSPPAKNGEPWIETVLYVFKGLIYGDGASPGGGLVMDAVGNLYGVTGYDGAGGCTLLGTLVGCGTIYELSPPSQQGGPWTETVLYSFQGGNDGYVPTGDLVFDQAGNLYGATLFGGGKGTNCDSLYGGNCGTIFELSPPKNKGGAWTEKVLHSFASVGQWSVFGDGAEPNGGLVLDGAGNLYGTTYFGGYAIGACNGGVGGTGCGTVFELLPPTAPGAEWRENVLYRFDGTDHGALPNGNLVLDAQGRLYGTVGGGPNFGQGIVFRLASVGHGQWQSTTLFELPTNQSDGAIPLAGVSFDSRGSLYGTASAGGSLNGGTFFRLSPAALGATGTMWQCSVLYDFRQGNWDASQPDSKLTFDKLSGFYGNSLYGGTSQSCGKGGCGTVYRLWP